MIISFYVFFFLLFLSSSVRQLTLPLSIFLPSNIAVVIVIITVAIIIVFVIVFIVAFIVHVDFNAILIITIRRWSQRI